MRFWDPRHRITTKPTVFGTDRLPVLPIGAQRIEGVVTCILVVA
jgi:hypothetical protein